MKNLIIALALIGAVFGASYASHNSTVRAVALLFLTHGNG